MNIFVLDRDPQKCAMYHNDCHVNKMLVESVQILSTVAHRHCLLAPYKPTHQNHPVVLWAGDSLANWLWLQNLAVYLYDEYMYRYGKTSHKSGLALEEFSVPPNSVFPETGLQTFVQCMPEQYQDMDPVLAYRRYYWHEKQHLARWTKRGVPEWWMEMESGK